MLCGANVGEGFLARGLSGPTAVSSSRSYSYLIHTYFTSSLYSSPIKTQTQCVNLKPSPCFSTAEYCTYHTIHNIIYCLIDFLFFFFFCSGCLGCLSMTTPPFPSPLQITESDITAPLRPPCATPPSFRLSDPPTYRTRARQKKN